MLDPVNDGIVNEDVGAQPAPRRSLAVIDLDGVLADVGHRLHHLDRTPKDWDGFFAGIGRDRLLPEGWAIVGRLVGDHEIVYVTGRPERTRSASQAWLKRHGLPVGELVMRPERDRRPARLVKRELVRSLARERVIAVVVDDDPAVCAALEADGWPVLRADWMPRPMGLEQAQEQLGRT